MLATFYIPVNTYHGAMDKIDIQSKLLRDKGHYIIIKGSVQQKFVHIYEPNIGARLSI